MKSNSLKKIKGKVIELKNNTMNYCKEHKTIIIWLVIGGVAMASITYLLNINQESKATISNLELKNKYLKDENANLKDDLEDANNLIDELVDLNYQKDEIMNLTMSDGLRHGSSVAAQQMAYKRWLN